MKKYITPLLVVLLGMSATPVAASWYNPVSWFVKKQPSTHVSSQASSQVQHSNAYGLTLFGKIAALPALLGAGHFAHVYGRCALANAAVAGDVQGPLLSMGQAHDQACKGYQELWAVGKKFFAPVQAGCKAVSADVQRMCASVGGWLADKYNNRDALLAGAKYSATGLLGLASLLLLYDTLDPAPEEIAAGDDGQVQRQIVMVEDNRVLAAQEQRKGSQGIQGPQHANLHGLLHRINKKLRFSSVSKWSLVLGVPAALLCVDLYCNNKFGTLTPDNFTSLGCTMLATAGLSSYSLRQLWHSKHRSKLNWIANKACSVGEFIGAYALSTLISNALYGGEGSSVTPYVAGGAALGMLALPGVLKYMSAGNGPGDGDGLGHPGLPAPGGPIVEEVE